MFLKNILTRSKDSKLPISGEFVTREGLTNSSMSRRSMLTTTSKRKRGMVSVYSLKNEAKDLQAKIDAIQRCLNDDAENVIYSTQLNLLSNQLNELKTRIKFMTENDKAEKSKVRSTDINNFLSSLSTQLPNIEGFETQTSSSLKIQQLPAPTSRDADISTIDTQESGMFNHCVSNLGTITPIISSSPPPLEALTDISSLQQLPSLPNIKNVSRRTPEIVAHDNFSRFKSRRSNISQTIEVICSCGDISCQKKSSNLKKCDSRNCPNMLSLNCKFFKCQNCKNR